MKKILFILSILLTGFAYASQDTVFVFKNKADVSGRRAILVRSNPDSIDIKNPSYALLYSQSMGVDTLHRSSTDSITFTWNHKYDTAVTISYIPVRFRGIVRDQNLMFLDSVTIISGINQYSTNEIGSFDLNETLLAANGRYIVKFSKPGYFDLIKSGYLPNSNNDVHIEVVLQSKDSVKDNAVYTTFEASNGTTLQAGAFKVTIPANGLVVESNGSDYTGTVNIGVLYFDPEGETFFERMPGGDLSGIAADGTTAALVSFGMADVTMATPAGDKLQLKEGYKSPLVITLSDTLLSIASDTIPLWSFNERTGLWVEENIATRQGNTFVGEVKHFSAVNLDRYLDDITFSGVVLCGGEPESGVLVSFQGLDYYHRTYQTYTNSSGVFSMTIPFYTDVFGSNYNTFTQGTIRISRGGALLLQGYTNGSSAYRVWTIPDCGQIVSGTLKDSCGNVLSGVNVVTTDGSLYTTTDINGKFSMRVHSNTVKTLTIQPNSYNYYSPQIFLDIAVGTNDIDTSITLPCIVSISGQIVNQCATDSSAVLWLEYKRNGQTQKEYLYVPSNGTFGGTLPFSDNDTVKVFVKSNNTDSLIAIIPEGNINIQLGPIILCDINPAQPAVYIKKSNGEIVYIPIDPSNFAIEYLLNVSKHSIGIYSGFMDPYGGEIFGSISTSSILMPLYCYDGVSDTIISSSALSIENSSFLVYDHLEYILPAGTKAYPYFSDVYNGIKTDSVFLYYVIVSREQDLINGKITPEEMPNGTFFFSYDLRIQQLPPLIINTNKRSVPCTSPINQEQHKDTKGSFLDNQPQTIPVKE